MLKIHSKEYVKIKDLISLFMDAANKYPHNTAVRSGDNDISYAELEQAVRILSAEIGPDCGVVGVIVTPSINTIVALLSVLAEGGTYCPIDAMYPIAKQQSLVRQVGCRIIIDTTNSEVVFSQTRCIKFTNISFIVSSEKTTIFPLHPENSDEAAYVLFTSGSTGTPKPVVTPRAAISTVCSSLKNLFKIRPDDRVLQFSALNWDTCFEEIFPTLTIGATLVTDSRVRHSSLDYLLRLLERERITVVNLPTTYWQELAHYLHENTLPLPSCLHTVVIGGEAVLLPRIVQWCQLESQQIRLINTYGCTETTLITHATDLCGPVATHSQLDWEKAERVPIGKRLPHVNELVSEEGELLIGGASLSSGYLGMPLETEKRFRLQASTGAAERFFHTGDRVELAPNGELYHLGRLDDQLKIRGIRVEPAAVEAELAKLPSVSCVAVVGEAISDHKRLVAYVVPLGSDYSRTAALNIRTSLNRKIPDHLVPSIVRLVKSLAYTSSGKIDRAATHRTFTSQQEQSNACNRGRENHADV